MNCSLCGAVNQQDQFCSNCGHQVGNAPPQAPSTTTDATITRPGGERSQAASAYLKLEPSEQAVFHAASRLYAAYITSGQLTDSNEGEVMKLAVTRAIQLALLTERSVQSDGEDW
jgi:uncharacterized membrane protein YvbJ